MKLPLHLTVILLSAAVCAAVPRGAAAESGPQAGAAAGAVAAAGTRTSAGAGARIPGAGASGAPANARSARPASANAAPAAQAAAREQARATEEKMAANARSDRVAKQQRATLLQAQHKTQHAAQALARSTARLGQGRAASTGMTTIGSARRPAAGQDFSAQGARGVTGTAQPGLRAQPSLSVTPTHTPIIMAPSSRVSAANGTIGGPHSSLSGRLGGPAQGATASHSAIDGSQLRRKF
jgi:hypothetical protein